MNRRQISLILIIAFGFTLCGCGASQDREEKAVVPTATLKDSLLDFQRRMKWGLYEQASLYVDDDHREGFLGRYEERGEEFKIVSLELISAVETSATAVVEVEQEWYDETMVVRKDRFIEIWNKREGVWMRGERMTKKEYRKQKKELADQLKREAADAEAAKAAQLNTDGPAPIETPSEQAQP